MQLLPQGSPLRSATEGVLAEIVEVLAAPSEIPREQNPSLGAGGDPARAIFFFHLAEASRDPKHFATARSYFHRCADNFRDTPLSFGLYTGFPGMAWVLAHTEGNLPVSERMDLADIDKLLHKGATAKGDHRVPFDLVNGLVGIGAYFLERMPRPDAEEGLVGIVRHLERLAEWDSAGARWPTHPEHIFGTTRSQYPKGRHDLGMAHGTPGVLAFLARVGRYPALLSELRALLEDAQRWVLSNRLPSHAGYTYPFWYAPDARGTPSSTRAGWCYGDPGVACALLASARTLNQPDTVEIAVGMARRSLARDPEEGGVVDASLCHGSAGLAHMAQVLGAEAHREDLLELSRRWIEHTVQLHDKGRGLAGYEYWRGEFGWGPDSTFLNGISGIGLALQSALYPGTSSWNRLLMLS